MGARFSAPVQTGRGAHPTSCTVGTGSLTGVKWRGRDLYHTPDQTPMLELYRGADKSLARLTSRCILFDGENISFDVSLVIYI